MPYSMNKYFFIIGILLALISASIAYSAFTLFPQTNNPASGVRRDVTITFSKETKTFVPQSFRVSKGDTVYVKFVNEDIHEHGIAIDVYGVMTRIPAKNTTLLPSFVATKAGSFIFYCPGASDSSLSETGTLVVSPSDK